MTGPRVTGRFEEQVAVFRALFKSGGTARRTKIMGDVRKSSPVTFVATLVGMVRAFVLARYLGPESYGWVATLNLVLTYTEFAHLGMSPGLQRQLLYYRGKENLEAERPLIGSALISWGSIAALVVLAIEARPTLFIAVTPGAMTLAMRMVGLLVALQAANVFLSVLMTVHKQFVEQSRIALVRASCELVLGVGLGLAFGVPGVFAGLLVAALTAFVLTLRATRFRPFIAFDRTRLLELLRIGTPISISVLAGTLLRSVDRVFIVKYLTPAAMGLYSLGSMVSSLIYTVPLTLAGVIVPHVTEAFAKHEGEEHKLQSFLVGPSVGFAWGAAGLGAVATAAAFWLTPYVLPKYVPGLPALAVLCVSAIFQSMILTAASILGNILISRRRFWLQVAAQIVTAGVNAAVCGTMLRAHPVIESVAYGSLAGSASYALVIMVTTAIIVLRQPRRVIGFLALTFAPAALALGGLWLL